MNAKFTTKQLTLLGLFCRSDAHYGMYTAWVFERWTTGHQF